MLNNRERVKYALISPYHETLIAQNMTGMDSHSKYMYVYAYICVYIDLLHTQAYVFNYPYLQVLVPESPRVHKGSWMLKSLT